MADTLINQTDAQGRKQGYWVETEEWGYTYKGNYVDGLREGVWKSYYRNGSLLSEGLWKEYDEDGIFKTCYLYKKDKYIIKSPVLILLHWFNLI